MAWHQPDDLAKFVATDFVAKLPDVVLEDLAYESVPAALEAALAATPVRIFNTSAWTRGRVDVRGW